MTTFKAARTVAAAAVFTLALAFPAATQTRDSLQIYFIDVGGGQSTLIVTPSGQSMLVDTGFPSNGRFDSKPGDVKQARDANRIVAAAKDAGVTKIDDLYLTHFHADHDGGVTELSELMPIGTFIDHDRPLPDAEAVKGTLEAYSWWDKVRAGHPHLDPKPGDTIPLTGVDVTVVSAAGQTIARPLPGAGEANAVCGPSAQPPQEPTENPRSNGFVLQFGKFRFFDPGDLTGDPLFALACPKDMIGPVDVYLVAHHGGADAADPATFAAWRPRAAIVNNGSFKGGTPNLIEALQASKAVQDSWELHHSRLPGGRDLPQDHVANLDDSTSYWIKITAHENGSFTVTNARTGESKAYPAR